MVEEPPAPTEALPGARADLKVEVKARKWLIDVAIVCPGVSAKAGEVVKRKKHKGAVQGFVVEAGGRLGPPRGSSTKWWRSTAASKIMRAIEVMHKMAKS